jgi:hypothetical protein
VADPPQAALFALCLALISYNVPSAVKAALRGAHGRDKIQDEASSHYSADEVAGVSRGMTILLTGDFRNERFAKQTPSQMAQLLSQCAPRVTLRVPQAPARAEKEIAETQSKKSRGHVSTQKILDARRRTPALH